MRVLQLLAVISLDKRKINKYSVTIFLDNLDKLVVQLKRRGSSSFMLYGEPMMVSFSDLTFRFGEVEGRLMRSVTRKETGTLFRRWSCYFVCCFHDVVSIALLTDELLVFPAPGLLPVQNGRTELAGCIRHHNSSVVSLDKKKYPRTQAIL